MKRARLDGAKHTAHAATSRAAAGPEPCCRHSLAGRSRGRGRRRRTGTTGPGAAGGGSGGRSRGRAQLDAPRLDLSKHIRHAASTTARGGGGGECRWRSFPGHGWRRRGRRRRRGRAPRLGSARNRRRRRRARGRRGWRRRRHSLAAATGGVEEGRRGRAGGRRRWRDFGRGICLGLGFGRRWGRWAGGRRRWRGRGRRLCHRWGWRHSRRRPLAAAGRGGGGLRGGGVAPAVRRLKAIIAVAVAAAAARGRGREQGLVPGRGAAPPGGGGGCGGGRGRGRRCRGRCSTGLRGAGGAAAGWAGQAERVLACMREDDEGGEVLRRRARGSRLVACWGGCTRVLHARSTRTLCRRADGAVQHLTWDTKPTPSTPSPTQPHAGADTRQILLTARHRPRAGPAAVTMH